MALYIGVAHGKNPAFLTWTKEQDELLKQLAAKGVTALRAAAALKRPTTSVRIRARKLGLSLPGVREVRRKLASAMHSEGDHV